MTEQRKLSFAFKAALATFIVYGLLSAIGLFNTIRWYAALPEVMAASPFPALFHLIVWKLVAQFLASVVGLAFLLLAGWGRSRLVSIGSIVVLLVVHFIGWFTARGYAPASDAFFIAQGVGLAVAAWLVFVLVKLARSDRRTS